MNITNNIPGIYELDINGQKITLDRDKWNELRFEVQRLEIIERHPAFERVRLINEIVRNPDYAPIPDGVDMFFLLHLAERVLLEKKEEVVAALIKYCSRISPKTVRDVMKLVHRENPSLVRNSVSWCKWFEENKSIFCQNL